MRKTNLKNLKDNHVFTYINTRFESVPDASCGDAGVVDVGQTSGSPESHLGLKFKEKFLKNEVKLNVNILLHINKLLNTQQRSHLVEVY